MAKQLDISNMTYEEQIALAMARSEETSANEIKQLTPPQGVDVKDVPGDGNCFFHSVVDQIHSLGIYNYTHLEVRNLAIQEILNNQDFYIPNIFIDFDTFIAQNSTPGTCADDVMIAATERALGVRINIYRHYGLNPRAHNPDYDHLPEINVFYSGGHYMSVTGVDPELAHLLQASTVIQHNNNASSDNLTYEEQLQLAITLSASETQQQMSDDVSQSLIETSSVNNLGELTNTEQFHDIRIEPTENNNPSINEGDISPIENIGYTQAVDNNTLSIINTHNDHSTNSTIDREAIYAWLREEARGNNNPSLINEENAQPNEPEQPILVNTYWDDADDIQPIVQQSTNEDTSNRLINTDFTLATENTQPENNNDNYSFNQADQDAIYQFLRNEVLNANSNQTHSIEVGNDDNDYDALLAQAIELSLENNGRTNESIARSLQEQQDAELARLLQMEEQPQPHNQHNPFENAIAGLIPNFVHALGGNNHDHAHIIDGMNNIYNNNHDNPLGLVANIFANIFHH